MNNNDLRTDLSSNFTNYINNFFNRLEQCHSNEVNSLKSRIELCETNLKTLMILIHKKYESGVIDEETYKTACLVYSMGDSETFKIDK